MQNLLCVLNAIRRNTLQIWDGIWDMIWDMGLYCETKEKIESLNLVGHLPREISWFCKYFLECNGELNGTIRSTKFCASLLLQVGLEIPIKLWVEKGKASLEIFRKMKGFLFDNYHEPEKIPFDVLTEEDEEDEFIATFQIFRLISLENIHFRIFKCNTVFYLYPL